MRLFVEKIVSIRIVLFLEFKNRDFYQLTIILEALGQIFHQRLKDIV